MSRLDSLLRRLGAAGILGVGVLIFCIPFYFSALRPAEQELTAQLRAAEGLRDRSAFRPAAADRRAEDLKRFHDLFPAVRNLTEELERVYALAHDADLRLMQGEYRLERRGAGLAAYRVSLPVRGTYAQLRSFLSALLKEMPIASVDALRFERKSIAEPQIEAQVRLTIHFRSNEAEAR